MEWVICESEKFARVGDNEIRTRGVASVLVWFRFCLTRIRLGTDCSGDEKTYAGLQYDWLQNIQGKRLRNRFPLFVWGKILNT